MAYARGDDAHSQRFGLLERSLYTDIEESTLEKQAPNLT